jgi:hypothetical protein
MGRSNIMSDVNFKDLQKGTSVIFARVIPATDCYELLNLHIVTVHEDYCTGTDQKTKQTYLFTPTYAEEVLFYNRKLAVEYLNSKKKGIKTNVD